VAELRLVRPCPTPYETTAIFVFSVLLALVTSACGQQPSVEKRLSDLEKRVTALEKASPLSSLLNAASPTPAVETKSPLELVSWDAHLVRGEYSNYNYKITLTLKNNSEKDIKLIDASVQFSDLFGSHIYGIKVTPDHVIPAGKTITDSGQYSVNQFMPEQARLAQMKKEDVKATLVVSKLVFTDNTIGEYAP
jgi:hypothetical protein